MARHCLIAALLLSLQACAPEPFIVGPEAAAPGGWVDYCYRHPTDPSC